MKARLLGFMALASLLLTGCEQQEDGSAAAAPPPKAPPAVTVASPLVKELVEWDEFTGRFEPLEQVNVRARVTGYLKSIHFTDGELVTKDQLLFVIDRRPFEVALNRAKAQVAEAEAQVQLANLELERARKLVNTSALSRATFDQRDQEMQVANAMLSAAQSDVAQAELDLDYTEIRAPITGRISNRRVDVGNLVQGDQSPTLLTTIVALDPIYLIFDMSETEYLAYQRAVEKGNFPSTRDAATPVQVRLVDEEGWPREGSMNFVDNVVDTGTATVRARAIVPNRDYFITPGQFARLRVPGSPRYSAVLIPDSAIVTDQSRKLVLTVNDDDTVVPKEITPGPRVFGLRIVRDGLDGSERVIINGIVRAHPGAKVAPEPGEITVSEVSS